MIHIQTISDFLATLDGSGIRGTCSAADYDRIADAAVRAGYARIEGDGRRNCFVITSRGRDYLGVGLD